MADIFLRSSDGNDGNAGTDKSAPKATMTSAVTAAGNAGRVFVSDLHAETQASAMTITPPTSFANMVKVICVPDWGGASGTTAPTSRSTGATVNTTGANNLSIVSGYFYSYGVSYRAGSLTNAADLILGTSSNSMLFIVEQCDLVLNGNNTGSDIILGNGVSTPVQSVRFRNVRTSQANASSGFLIRCNFLWENDPSVGSVFIATVPTVLFETGTGIQGLIRLDGVDLSAAGSGKTIIDVNVPAPRATFVNCKLNASLSNRVTGTFTVDGADIIFTNCSSADTSYDFYRAYAGCVETHETTIVRASGAVQPDGIAISRKIATSANVSVLAPYRALPILFWNDLVGVAQTISIPVLTDNVTLTDAEAFLVLEYLGVSGETSGKFGDDRVADSSFGTAASQPTDSASSWTTTGIGTPVKQTLDVTLTAEEKGLIRAWICIAKASATVYYDPKALTTSSRQYQSEAAFMNEGAISFPGVTNVAVFAPRQSIGY